MDKATAVSNSGRGFHKGDAILDGYLVDYKHITSTFTLKKDAWQKHSKDAWEENHLNPLIKVVFGNEASSVAIIDWQEFLYMKACVEKVDKNLNG